MTTAYPEAKIVDALAALELNRGNLDLTARQVGVSRPTLRKWRDAALAVSADLPLKRTDPDFASILAGKELKVLDLIGKKAPDATFRDLSIFAGIAADKHLDYRDGRKGTNVNVDARQQNLNVYTADSVIGRLLAARERGVTLAEIEAVVTPAEDGTTT